MFDFLKKLFRPKAQLQENKVTGQAETASGANAPEGNSEAEALFNQYIATPFGFLERDYQYRCAEKSLKHGVFQVLFVGRDRQVFIRMQFDMEKLAVLVFNGHFIEYKKHLDTEYVRDVFWLGEKHDPLLTWPMLQPIIAGSWEIALQRNADILKKYGAEILNGEEWF